jgi:hypothetical protein
VDVGAAHQPALADDLAVGLEHRDVALLGGRAAVLVRQHRRPHRGEPGADRLGRLRRQPAFVDEVLAERGQICLRAGAGLDLLQEQLLVEIVLGGAGGVDDAVRDGRELLGAGVDEEHLLLDADLAHD